jgi:hypothetical protein
VYPVRAWTPLPGRPYSRDPKPPPRNSQVMNGTAPVNIHSTDESMKENNDKQSPPRSQTLTTSDTGLAAFLRTQGAKLIDTSQQDGRIAWTFEHPAIKDLELAFFNDAPVRAQTFLGNLRSLTGMTRRGRP